MKLTAEQVKAMADLIEPLDTEAVRDKYRKGEFPRSELVKDLNRRYRWDLYYAAKCGGVLREIEGLTDAHIETALRRIVPGL